MHTFFWKGWSSVVFHTFITAVVRELGPALAQQCSLLGPCTGKNAAAGSVCFQYQLRQTLN